MNSANVQEDRQKGKPTISILGGDVAENTLEEDDDE
jgi:hypothetical protein